GKTQRRHAGVPAQLSTHAPAELSAGHSERRDEMSGKKALIVVDIQNDYFPGGLWTLSQVEAAAAKAAEVIAAFRDSGDLVVHIRHEFTSQDAPFFRPDSEGAQIHPSVINQPGEPVVLKHYINSFRETDLKPILDQAGVSEVVVVGNMSHMCVDGI